MIRTTSTRGFSLTEMLVALGVLSLGALLLAGTVGRVGYGLAVWEHDDARAADVAAAEFTLRQRLSAMQPVHDTQAGGGVVDVAGRTEAIDFVAPAPDRDAPDALRRYRLLRDAGGNLVLFSLSTLDVHTDPHGVATQGWKPETLLGGIAHMDIRYWGRDPGAGTRRSALPMLVRISVRFPDGDTRVWPDLVIRPRAAVPEPCPEDSPCAAPGGQV